MKTAYFAGGCFWCITPTFQEFPGVFRVTSGYCGGREENPSYEDVKYQRTGHRETIRIDYEETAVSYPQLLDIFLSGVDPYDEGGQFIDRGHSYTLAVYYTSPEEQQLAAAAKQRWNKKAVRRCISAWNPSARFIPPRKNIRIIIVSIRRHSARN